MGVGDWLREKASNIPGYTKPLTDAAKALKGAPAAPVAAPVVVPDIAPTVAPPGTPAANRQIWNKGTVEAAPAPAPSPQGLVVSPNVGIEKIRQGQD